MIKGTSYTVAYTAYDTSDGTAKTGDAANHTAYLSYNGGAFSAVSNTKTERGYGVYVITLTTTQTNYDTVVLQVVSSTSNVYCPPVQMSFDAAPLTAANVWGYSTRGVTSVPSTVATTSALSTVSTNVSSVLSAVGGLPTASQNASAVWSNGTRTLTASPTDVSSLATSSAVASLQTSVNAIPTVTYTIPTAAQNATAIWSAGTRTLTAGAFDSTGLATSAALATVDANVDAIVAKLPATGRISNITASDLPDVTSLESDLTAIESTVGTIRTACTTIEGYTDDVETLVQALPSAANIAVATWTYANRSITAPVAVTGGSVTEIQAGLARAAQIGSMPTVLEITTGVWGADSRTLTSGGGEGTPADVSCIMNFLLNKPDIRE